MAVFHVFIDEQAASLPMDRYEAERLLYGLGLDQPGAEYEMELVDSDYLLVLDSNFRELNRLAHRIGQMDELDRETLCAWCESQDPCTVDDALRASYHLDKMEFHPGFDSDEAISEVALESEEYDILPDDAFALLDRAKVGARMREQDGGVFANGGYLVVVQDFANEDIPAEEPLPFFQGRFNYGTVDSTWFDVPLSEADEGVLLEYFGVGDFNILGMDCRSSVPQLSGLTSESVELPGLRDMAGFLSEISSGDLMKYQALLEIIKPGSICEALRLAYDMGQYEVSPDYADPAVYGLQHAQYRYNLDEDCPLMEHMNLASYGAEMLLIDGYTQTRYGAVYTEDMEFDEVMAAEQTEGLGGMGGMN